MVAVTINQRAMNPNRFDEKAKTWDEELRRAALGTAIARG
jgi:hypothetical protein